MNIDAEFMDRSAIHKYNQQRLPTTINRLLAEVSWEGSKIANYKVGKAHEGGRGFENVLTAEVFNALDFLPREHFLGSILASAHTETQPSVVCHK